MSEMKKWATLLTFWGAILSFILGIIQIVWSGYQLALFLPWLIFLGPAVFMPAGYLGWAVVGIVCAFIAWRIYLPRMETDYKATGIPLIILGIIAWGAVGGFLIFIAGILVLVDKEE